MTLRKDDWVASIVHHILCVCVIVAFFISGATRVVVVALMLHNIFDPFVNLAKNVHYLYPPPSGLHLMADLSFFVSVVVFGVARLIGYPWLIFQYVKYYYLGRDEAVSYVHHVILGLSFGLVP